jgi:protoheme ferro-lyase
MNKPPKYECEHCPHYSTCTKTECNMRMVFRDSEWIQVTQDEYDRIRRYERKYNYNHAWVNAIQ